MALTSLIDHRNVEPMHGSYEVIGPNGRSGDACIVRPGGNGWVVDFHRPGAGVEQDSEHDDLEGGLAAAFRRLGLKP